VPELPLGPTGKVARRHLRELAAAPGGAQTPPADALAAS
jgi:acyl-coenzyme A synthetase/AMP-(fatty) acid ligase